MAAALFGKPTAYKILDAGGFSLPQRSIITYLSPQSALIAKDAVVNTIQGVTYFGKAQSSIYQERRRACAEFLGVENISMVTMDHRLEKGKAFGSKDAMEEVLRTPTYGVINLAEPAERAQVRVENWIHNTQHMRGDFDLGISTPQKTSQEINNRNTEKMPTSDIEVSTDSTKSSKQSTPRNSIQTRAKARKLSKKL